jgi:hypothetical protein
MDAFDSGSTCFRRRADDPTLKEAPAHLPDTRCLNSPSPFMTTGSSSKMTPEVRLFCPPTSKPDALQPD